MAMYVDYFDVLLYAGVTLAISIFLHYYVGLFSAASSTLISEEHLLHHATIDCDEKTASFSIDPSVSEGCEMESVLNGNQIGQEIKVKDTVSVATQTCVDDLEEGLQVYSSSPGTSSSNAAKPDLQPLPPPSPPPPPPPPPTLPSPPLAPPSAPNESSDAAVQVGSGSSEDPPEGVNRMEEVLLLQERVDELQKEVKQYQQVLEKVENENSLIRDRLSEQAKAHLDKSPSVFEDLSLGEYRPTVLVTRYGNIYFEERLEAWDALDELPEIADISDDNREKILFSVVVLCFRRSRRSFENRLASVKELLRSCQNKQEHAETTNNKKNEGELLKDVDASVQNYLRKTIPQYDTTNDLKVVRDQLYGTLYNTYPSLRDCTGLNRYTEECLKTAWGLTVQSPTYSIEYDSSVFSDQRHTRFHTSDPDSDVIRTFLWPALVEATAESFVVSKAVVIT